MPRQTIQEYLGVPGEWEVREKLRHEIVLHPNRDDIRKAKVRDPLACALHNAACRMYDIPNCAIGGRWAYIPQRDVKGRYYIARMQAPLETQAAIKKFDRTGEMPEGGFRFTPIAKTHRYAVKNAYQRARTKELRKREADEVSHGGTRFKITRGVAAKKRVLKKRRTRSPPMRSMPTGLRT